MKKHSKAEPDLEGMIRTVQQQITFLDKKIDEFIGKFTMRPVEVKQPPKPFQPPVHQQRVMHKAICADCKKECEIPFRPSPDRPVYCRDCFSKRKAGGGQGHSQFAPKSGAPVKTENAPSNDSPFKKFHKGQAKKSGGKKKSLSKKSKKH